MAHDCSDDYRMLVKACIALDISDFVISVYSNCGKINLEKNIEKTVIENAVVTDTQV